jgi:large subunit ribosomal protein L25
MTQKMKATARTEGGKGATRRLRTQGQVPAILYGMKEDVVSLALDGHDLAMAMQAGSFFTHKHTLSLEGKNVDVLARDMQRHPVTEQVQHVDFIRYNPKQTLKVAVAVTVVGEEDSPGIQKGGVLQLVRSEVELICRADSIPDEIVVSMAGKDIGDSAHMSEIELPEGVHPAIRDRDFTIASVVGTRTASMSELDEEAEAEGEEGEATEEGSESMDAKGEEADKPAE